MESTQTFFKNKSDTHCVCVLFTRKKEHKIHARIVFYLSNSVTSMIYILTNLWLISAVSPRYKLL